MASREWYVSWFNTQDYLDLYKHRDEHDAKKILKLIFKNIRLRENAKVLDLACGSGRHALLIAKKGFNVVGIDLSKFLISEAKKKLKTEYKKYWERLRFEIRDMKDFSFSEKFDLVVNMFTSFGYFEKNSDNEKVIRCVSNALKPGGFFVLDFLNREHVIKRLVPYSIGIERNRTILQLRKIIGNFVVKDLLVVKQHGSLYEFKQYLERIRLYSLDELRNMFGKYGLKISKLFGDYKGSKYHRQASPRLILIAQRA